MKFKINEKEISETERDIGKERDRVGRSPRYRNEK